MSSEPSLPPAGERRRRQRRRDDRRRGSSLPAPLDGVGVRRPGRLEQIVQGLTRYLFCFLGLLFFNVTFPEGPQLVSLTVINATFLTYLVINTVSFLHMLRRPDCPWRYRAHMWLDICMVSLALVADPNEVPPSALVYIMVVLGNGMRYGLRLFGEAVIGAFAGAMLAISLRYMPEGLNPGLLYLNLFGGIILIYAYILMTRVEKNRLALQRASHVDSLTGLYNRGALELFSRHLFARAERSGATVAVLFADMDNFKQVNDRHGHIAGDRVLRHFGLIARSSIRSTDVAGRYGGDEFVILLPDSNLEEARGVAERIRQRICDWTGEQNMRCGMSFGIAAAPAHGNELEVVMHHVDRAMYEAKRDGNTICLVTAAPETTLRTDRVDQPQSG